VGREGVTALSGRWQTQDSRVPQRRHLS